MYIITSVEDQAAAVSQVVVKLTFPKSDHSGSITKEVSFRIVFLDQENNSLIRSEPGGAWRIVQHSLSNVLYGLRA